MVRGLLVEGWWRQVSGIKNSVVFGVVIVCEAVFYISVYIFSFFFDM